MKYLFLGIDLGTSSIKIAVQDSQQKEYYHNNIYYEYETLNNNWNEINPDKWFQLIMSDLTTIFEHAWSKNIVGICLTGQMHSIVFINQAGMPVRNAILWNDKRTLNSIETIREQLDKFETTKLNAQTVSAGSPLANLLWLKENESENYNNIYKFLMPKDYINFRLTGHIATDFCDGSTTSLYDFYQEDWSEQVMELFDLPESIFPKLRHSSYNLGSVLPELKKQLNFTQDIQVFVGTGDNAATFYAANTTEANDLVVSIGTSGVVLVAGDTDNLSKIGKNIAFKLLPTDKNIIVQGSLSTAGEALSWWIEDVLKELDYAKEQAGIVLESIHEANEVFIPYMTGEKYIYKNGDLKGAFLNISPDTTRERMTLSVLEGISFSLKNLADKLTFRPYDHLKMIGGGAKSDLWKEIFANVFQKNVKNYSSLANAVNGAIKIAQVGYFESDLEINDSNINVTKYSSKISSAYDEKYKTYLNTVDMLNKFYKC